MLPGPVAGVVQIFFGLVNFIDPAMGMVKTVGYMIPLDYFTGFLVPILPVHVDGVVNLA